MMNEIKQSLKKIYSEFEKLQEDNNYLKENQELKCERKQSKKTLWEQYEQDKKNFKPIPEYYYYIDDMQNVVCCKFDIHCEASMLQYEARKKVNNVYEDSQQAEQYRENLKTKTELKALAEELNGEKVIDWENRYQSKYSFNYNHVEKTLEPCYNNYIQEQGRIYCLNAFFLKKAKESIGEQRLIDMIKAGA